MSQTKYALDRNVAPKILHCAEMIAKEPSEEWSSDIYGKVVSVISSQLKLIAD